MYDVGGLFRTADGQIVVANGGSRQIRVFDATGALRAEMGGSGPGPEEFLALRGLFAFARDSLIAWDPLTSRFAVWSLSGRFGRTIPIRSGFPPEVKGRLSDGRLVLSTRHQILPLGSVVLGGVYSDTMEVAILDVVRRTRHRLGLFPGRQVVATKSVRGRLQIDGMPDGAQGVIAAHSDRVFVGTTDSNEIEVFDGTGTALAYLHLPLQAKPRDDAAAERWKADLIASRPPGTRPRLRRYLDQQLPQPTVYPIFDRLIVDDDGRIWVRSYPDPTQESARWVILDQDGKPAGEITMPVAFDPASIGRDWILGTLVGELDREMVALFPLPERLVVSRE